MEFTIENRLLRRGCSSAVLINLITNPNFLMWKAIGLLKATRFLFIFLSFSRLPHSPSSFLFLVELFFITIFCLSFCGNFLSEFCYYCFLLGIVAIIFSWDFLTFIFLLRFTVVSIGFFCIVFYWVYFLFFCWRFFIFVFCGDFGLSFFYYYCFFIRVSCSWVWD